MIQPFINFHFLNIDKNKFVKMCNHCQAKGEANQFYDKFAPEF